MPSINGNDEETNSDIHEEERVEGKSFSPSVDCSTNERICGPRAPYQGYGRYNCFEDHIVIIHHANHQIGYLIVLINGQ